VQEIEQHTASQVSIYYGDVKVQPLAAPSLAQSHAHARRQTHRLGFARLTTHRILWSDRHEAPQRRLALSLAVVEGTSSEQPSQRELAAPHASTATRGFIGFSSPKITLNLLPLAAPAPGPAAAPAAAPKPAVRAAARAAQRPRST
jgi:hypothetical protein